MKMRMGILAAALVLAGCANQKLADFQQWNTDTKAAATRGEIKWSDYYTQAYQRVSGMQEINGSNSIMRTYAELIPIARKYEAGQISKEEFEDARRMATVTANDRLAKDRADYERQQAINAQNTANAIQLIQAGQAKPATQPLINQTNCTSRAVGNTVQTNCW